MGAAPMGGAGMSRFGLLHRVYGQESKGVDAQLVKVELDKILPC